MKAVCITIALSLSWGACIGAQPVPVEAGQPVSLRIGESARAAAGELRFGFERVTADSRCPKGEQCVSAGDATVRLWLRRGAGPREPRELHTAKTSRVGGSGSRSGSGSGDAAADRELRLLRLDPWPVAGTAIAAGDYVATLALTGGPVADPER